MDRETLQRFKRVVEGRFMGYVVIKEAFEGVADEKFQGC